MPNITFPRGTIVKLQSTCDACRDGIHASCNAWLNEVFGMVLGRDCPCPCRDETGSLTEAALTEMARRQPERLARHVRFQEDFARGSFDVHFRGGRSHSLAPHR